jgi:putative restriction endonuclease
MINLFSEELNNPNTKFFIFDTGKHENIDAQSDVGDIDFERYTWNRKRFNKVDRGDLFIYRKISNASENKIFYFYGVGKISDIKDINETLVHGLITKGILFDDHITRDDLIEIDFLWDSKTKKSKGYERFFNNYGMDQISKKDFIALCALSFKDEIIAVADNSYERIQIHNNIEEGRYRVEDQFTSGSKTRGPAQSVFSNKVRSAYNWECCISGINTKSLLVGAHIIPWADNKDTRGDPRNGLCLNMILHKCFDDGLMSISENYRVLVDTSKTSDSVLCELLDNYSNKEISLPKNKDYYPLSEYLRYHRDKHGF